MGIVGMQLTCCYKKSKEVENSLTHCGSWQPTAGTDALAGH